MRRKQTLLVAALVGSFCLGCLVGGAVLFFRSTVPLQRTVVLDAVTDAGNRAYVTYRYGSYPVAKAALLERVETLTNVGRLKGLLSESQVAIELGLTYGRIAALAERAGQPDDAVRYMALAIQELSKRRQPVDDKQVREAVDRWDAAWDQRLGAGARGSR